VPEAAVNENDGFVFGQDKVGTAGQFAVVQPAPVAHPVQEGGDDEFGFGIFAADAAHVPASMRFG
jgi:hypothetical protein